MILEQCDFSANSTVGVAKSIFTGEEQIHAFPGQWWTAMIRVAATDQADARAVAAWLTSMRGREKTFLLGDPAASAPRGTASSSPGTPVVNGASQTGNSLVGDGAPTNETGWLLSGDYIQLGSGSSSRLYMVLEDANTDGSGNFTLEIWPDLRVSPGDGNAITVLDAKGLFRLGSNQIGWNERTIVYGFSFDATEVL
jgi:hypothetical protein